MSGVVQLPAPWRDAAVTVVLPTYNEADNLPVLLERLFALPLTALRVLVADDNSPDGTGKVAEGLANQYGTDRVAVVHRPGKQGLGRAYVDGMSRALADGAEFVVQMDSDLSHPPEAIPPMLGTLLATDADVVIGSRYVSGGSVGADWGLHRKVLSWWANVYVQTLLSMRIRDVTAGFKLWRRDTLLALDLESVRSNGYSFQVEMNYRVTKLGYTVVEVPIHFAERERGTSKMSLTNQLESAVMPFRLRWQNRRLHRRHPGAGPAD